MAITGGHLKWGTERSQATMLGYISHVPLVPRTRGAIMPQLLSLRENHPDELVAIAGNFHAEDRKALVQSGVAVFDDPTVATEAVAKLVAAGQAFEKPVCTPSVPETKTSDVGAALEEAGVVMVSATPVATETEALAALEHHGTVVLKLAASGLEHRTELDGVHVGLQTPDAVRAAFASLSAAMTRHAEQYPDLHIRAEPMVRGVEMLVGTRSDPHFGPLVLLGSGGAHCELFDDVVYAKAPVAADEARGMIAAVRAERMLDGWRGAPAVDREALCRNAGGSVRGSAPIAVAGNQPADCHAAGCRRRGFGGRIGGSQHVTDITHFIDGQPVKGEGPVLDDIDPATGQVIGRLPEATEAQVAEAVSAASRSFASGAWAEAPVRQRQSVLRDAARAIRDDADTLVDLQVAEGGMTPDGVRGQVMGAAAWFDYFADFLSREAGETYQQLETATTLVNREPIGVCALFSPWNVPVTLSAIKLAPALAAGNSVVLKPSEETPMVTRRLADLIHGACLPDGVLNVVNGRGAVTGAALADAPDVAMISFTGGSVGGRAVAEAAARRHVPCVMELGGKSATIVFEDADIDAALEGALTSIYSANGEACLGRVTHSRSGEHCRGVYRTLCRAGTSGAGW